MHRFIDSLTVYTLFIMLCSVSLPQLSAASPTPHVQTIFASPIFGEFIEWLNLPALAASFFTHAYAALSFQSIDMWKISTIST
jgi:hypothetical protein